jgi:tetratricopeptide (TPR) repeat protein
LTPATDIYALGIVIYEMMTGLRPFIAETPIASALRRITGPGPKRPREIKPELPAEWDRAIMRCLARFADDRFPDATSVIDALTRPGVAAIRKTTPRLVAAVAAGLIVVAAAGAIMWRSKTTSPSTTSAGESASATVPADRARPAIAVLGFRNLAGRQDAQWLSTAISEMLTTELGAGERLRTIPGENVNRMKSDLALADADSYASETLARIRQNLGTDFVVVGSYVTVGEADSSTLRLDIRLQDSREGRTVSLVSETGRATELLDVVSRAGSRLRERLGVDAVPATMAAVRASQPASPEAARLYAEGLIHLRGFDALGARPLLERAIEVDSKFPLTYSALASTWSALGYEGRARDAAARAFELSTGLPRAERLQVEATYREMSSAWKDAIAIWRTLTTSFPDDIEPALRLAHAQIASGAAKEGLATLETFKTRFPAVKDPRLDLSEAQAADALSDFKRAQTASAAAAAAGEALGARLLVAGARLSEGSALLRLGEQERAMTLIEEARGIFQAAGDRTGVARTLNNLGTAILNGPDITRARALYEEGLRIARAVGSRDLVARLLNNIAVVERRAGNLQASLKLNQESLAIRRDIGDRSNAAVSLNNIGNVLLDLGDLQGASQHYEESAAMSREMGDRMSMARALYNASESLSLQGQIARARSTAEEALTVRRGIDDPAGVSTSLYGLGRIAALQGDTVGAKQFLNAALDMDRRLDRRRAMAYSTYELAEIALVEGDTAAARRGHQDSLDIRTKLGEKGTAAESRAALARLALEENRAPEAESLAREAALVFAGQSAPGNEAMARAALALALSAQDRRAAAVREIENAQSLVRNPQHVLARFPVRVAAARIYGITDPAGSLAALEAIRADAATRGLVKFEFEARRAIAEIERRRSPEAGATLLTALRRDAKARGYGLYTR